MVEESSSAPSEMHQKTMIISNTCVFSQQNFAYSSLVLFTLCFILFSSCYQSKKIASAEQTPPIETEQQTSLDSKTTIVETQFFPDNQFLQELLVIDFVKNQAYFIEKSIDGEMIAEGTFDPKTYRSDSLFLEQIWIVSHPELGLIGAYHHSFNLMKEGVWKYYNRGKVQIIGAYLQNQKNGQWSYYDEDGNIAYVRIYDMGLLVSDSIIGDLIYASLPK